MCTGRDIAWKPQPAHLQEGAVHVRLGRPSDSPALLRLTRQLAAEHGDTAEDLSVDALARALWGPQPLLHALVAEARDGIAGSALYSVGYSTFSGRPRIWIEDVIVSLRHRRHGVGSALVAALRSRASELGAIEMFGLVSDGNPRAQAFWRDQGGLSKPGWSMINTPVAEKS